MPRRPLLPLYKAFLSRRLPAWRVAQAAGRKERQDFMAEVRDVWMKEFLNPNGNGEDLPHGLKSVSLLFCCLDHLPYSLFVKMIFFWYTNRPDPRLVCCAKGCRELFIFP